MRIWPSFRGSEWRVILDVDHEAVFEIDYQCHSSSGGLFKLCGRFVEGWFPNTIPEFGIGLGP